MRQNEASLNNIVVGDQFGPYTIVGRLGVGGMAETFVAIRTGPGGFAQRVCLKLVLPFYREDEDFVRLFEREARLAAKLRHSNIVGVIDFGDMDGTSYMALELVDGLDLRAFLDAQNDNRLPSESVVLCGLAMAYALDHAHKPHHGSGADDDASYAQGIVHRDISPSNILISRRGEVLLTDFGVARAISGTSRQKSAVKGKVPYMAPEYLRSEPLDGRADLFSLGVVLFESLAGERPYEGDHDPAIIMRILKGEHPPLAKLAPRAPQGVCEIIERLLEPDRENRPPNAAAVIEALDEFAPSPKVRLSLGQQVTDLRDRAEQDPPKSASRSNPKRTEALPETPEHSAGKSGTRDAQPSEQRAGAEASERLPGAALPSPGRVTHTLPPGSTEDGGGGDPVPRSEPVPLREPPSRGVSAPAIPISVVGPTGERARSRGKFALIALAAALTAGGMTAWLWTDTEADGEVTTTDAPEGELPQRTKEDMPAEDALGDGKDTSDTPAASDETGPPAEATLAGGEDTSDTPAAARDRGAVGSPRMSQGIQVRRRMDGAHSSQVPRNVQSQCRGFGTILPSNLARRNSEIVIVENFSGQGKRLALEISYVRAKGGGAFSGSKKMEVTGKLLQGRGKVLGSFTAYRGSYKGKACKSLYRVEQELAKDIALWLEHPGMYDKLGAAK